VVVAVGWVAASTGPGSEQESAVVVAGAGVGGGLLLQAHREVGAANHLRFQEQTGNPLRLEILGILRLDLLRLVTLEILLDVLLLGNHLDGVLLLDVLLGNHRDGVLQDSGPPAILLSRE